MRRPVDTPERLEFRRMQPEDLDRVVDIERAGFRNPWSRELLARELDHAWSHIVLAVDRDAGAERVLGYIVFWLVHDELHVLNIATAIEARRRGVGRALMLEAHGAGKDRGAVVATLEVRRSNAPALELYRSLGYRQVGIRPNYYQEEGEDAIVMILDL
ncbi:ribosomal protein S18-alanine N-acetyltransferase [Anaeromyxobacter terrae]|uniref:ribosomal protein S18-alanine N-acetyltransferase n=1 Tax=Anaeromyxobacter terrae TaxID=2925406 RepID=UPI001F576D11|nr:ribosomal protein S18-alanine N-acetyltransferase [Anaeromyxobacter sp. SG22]